MSTGPYGSLEPPSPDPERGEPLYPHAGLGTTLVRGLRKRCPRCGEPGVFRSWFEMRDRCQACGLGLMRETGGYLGAMTINYGVASGVWIVMLVVVLAFTVPDVPVAPLLIASVAIFVGVPLWFYPRAKGAWAAVEFLIERAEPEYREPMRRDPRAGELE